MHQKLQVPCCGVHSVFPGVFKFHLIGISRAQWDSQSDLTMVDLVENSLQATGFFSPCSIIGKRMGQRDTVKMESTNGLESKQWNGSDGMGVIT